MQKGYFAICLAVLMFFSAAFIAGCAGPAGTPASGVLWISTTRGSDETGSGNYNKPYKTINKGMTEAKDGNIIIVEGGNYTETVSWGTAKNIHLKGMTTESTVIDGEGVRRCINAGPSTGDTITIEGLTLKNGKVSGGTGAAIYISTGASGFHFKKLIIKNSIAAERGGGIGNYYYMNNDLLIESCTIENNSADYGGGIYCQSPATIKNCVINNNRATSEGGGIGFGATAVNGTSMGGRMENCVIFKNSAGGSGGGVFINMNGSSSTVQMYNCTIVTNDAVGGGGGGISTESVGTVDIVNSIIWDNLGKTATNNDVGGVCQVRYSDLKKWNPVLIGGALTLEGVNPSFEAYPPDEAEDLKLTALTTTEITDKATNEADMPAKDYAGYTRPSKNSMGAFEYDGNLP